MLFSGFVKKNFKKWSPSLSGARLMYPCFLLSVFYLRADQNTRGQGIILGLLCVVQVKKDTTPHHCWGDERTLTACAVTSDNRYSP